MIFSLVSWALRKVLSLILIIILIIWYFFLRGKDINYTQWMYTGFDWVKNSVSVNITPNTTTLESLLTPEVKEGIDAWLISQNLNQYGDPIGTVYAGASPLFNEATGVTTDRYIYILTHHPELVKTLQN